MKKRQDGDEEGKKGAAAEREGKEEKKQEKGGKGKGKERQEAVSKHTNLVLVPHAQVPKRAAVLLLPLHFP